MNEKKQLFSELLSGLQKRKENTNREDYEPLIEETETLLQQCAANEIVMDIGEDALSELYFLAAELLFEHDLSVRTATRSRTLANEAKTLEYFNKAIAIQDKEAYSYELWNFLSTAGHTNEGIAALERFIERTGGTAKILARAAEYVLMYADSEDAETIKKSVDYFYRAIELEPDRYETYWAFWTDLEEAVDVCPQLLKEAFLCLDKLIALSLPETAGNHDTLANRYFDLASLCIRTKEYEKALEAAKKGLAIRRHDYGTRLVIETLLKLNRFQEAIPYCSDRVEALLQAQQSNQNLARAFFDLAHCYHVTGQPKLAAKYYLAFENGADIVPPEYKDEFLLYDKQSKSFIGRIKKLLRKMFHRS